MTYFEPMDEREHERGGRGIDVPDYCRNCKRSFMDHTNGRCPSDPERPYRCAVCGETGDCKPGCPADASDVAF